MRYDNAQMANGKPYALPAKPLQGRYKLLELISKTKTNEVYLTADLTDKVGRKFIAKKNISKNLNFAHEEIKTLMEIKCQGIPEIHDFFWEDNEFYIIMQYIEGQSLDKAVSNGTPLKESAVRNYMLQLCSVFIKALHRTNDGAQPILHLDIKPGNIMLDSYGDIWLIDFGISSRGSNEAGWGHGTPGYGAPEQFKSKGPYGVTADIYGFGATMYYLLTGQKPEDPLVRPVTPLNEVNANISEGMCGIITSCIKKDPDERFQSFKQVKAALDEIDERTSRYREYSEACHNKYKREMRHYYRKIMAVCVIGALFSVMLTVGATLAYREWADMTGKEILEKVLSAEEKVRFMNYGEAREDAESALNLNPNGDMEPRIRHIIGITYFYEHDYYEAESHLRLAMDAAPDNPVYIRDLAVCLTKLGQEQKARTLLECLPGGDLNGQYIIGQIYESEGDHINAIKFYEKCYSAEGELRALAYIAAARLAYEVGGGLDVQIAILEEAEENPTLGRYMVLDMLIACYSKKAENTNQKDERDFYYKLALNKSLLYKEQVGGILKIYEKIAELYRNLDMIEESRLILDEAVNALGELHELYYQYAITEIEEVRKMPRLERSYDMFNYYARLSILLAPHENSRTTSLRGIAEDYGIKGSDPIWE